MESLPEFVELLMLAVASSFVLLFFVFRPTSAGRDLRASAASASRQTADAVLGELPSEDATRSYRRLLRDAMRAGVAIDWNRARRDHTATTGDIQLSLIAEARHQVPSY